MKLSLLTHSSAKIDKSMGYGVLTVILHLSPADLSGREVCPFRSVACTALCLNTSGHGGIGAGTLDEIKTGTKTNSVQACRARRTKLYFEDRPRFMAMLESDIEKAYRYATARGFKLAVRLNGTSDLPWSVLGAGLFKRWPDVAFYDYTKNPRPAFPFGRPDNYSLTFSLSESNDDAAVDVLAMGGRVAVIVRTKEQAADIVSGGFYWLGGHRWDAIDGDASDLRYQDAPSSCVILYAKGRAKTDVSGMVRG